jgi:hypothetical protein
MAKRVIVDHANHIMEMLRDVADEKGLSIETQPDDLAFQHDWRAGHVTLHNKKWTLAHFQVQQMPGCCAIMTLSYVEYRDPKQLSFEGVVEIVEEAAKRAAFGSLVLTQVVREEISLAKHSWHKLVRDHEFVMSPPFINAKSGNKVVYLTKDLGQQGKMDGFETRVLA